MAFWANRKLTQIDNVYYLETLEEVKILRLFVSDRKQVAPYDENWPKMITIFFSGIKKVSVERLKKKQNGIKIPYEKEFV